MNESTGHYELELSAYLDGELDATAHRNVEAHLSVCPDCASLLEELRAVIAGARVLEDRAPESDLWPAIAERIDADRAPASSRPASRGQRSRGFFPRFSFSLPQLATAALCVALLSGGTVWWLGRSKNSARISSPASASIAMGTDASSADFETRRYDQAVSDLRQVLNQNHDRLDPETVRTVESNLAVIDGAIMQARRALMADPANPYLSGHLADQMKRKVRVLQQAADAVTAEYGGAS